MHPTDIVIRDGRIVAVGALRKDAAPGDALDAAGRLVAPGFIDVHIQGADGADVLDGTREALACIARTAARFGITGWLATACRNST